MDSEKSFQPLCTVVHSMLNVMHSSPVFESSIIDCFHQPSNIPPGKPVFKALQKFIRQAPKMVSFVSQVKVIKLPLVGVLISTNRSISFTRMNQLNLV